MPGDRAVSMQSAVVFCAVRSLISDAGYGDRSGAASPSFRSGRSSSLSCVIHVLGTDQAALDFGGAPIGEIDDGTGAGLRFVRPDAKSWRRLIEPFLDGLHPRFGLLVGIGLVMIAVIIIMIAITAPLRNASCSACNCRASACMSSDRAASSGSPHRKAFCSSQPKDSRASVQFQPSAFTSSATASSFPRTSVSSKATSCTVPPPSELEQVAPDGSSRRLVSLKPDKAHAPVITRHIGFSERLADGARIVPLPFGKTVPTALLQRVVVGDGERLGATRIRRRAFG